MIRVALIALLAGVALLASACGEGKSTREDASAGAPARQRQLTDLRDIGQLRSLFNTRSGEPRLIVLVSPT